MTINNYGIQNNIPIPKKFGGRGRPCKYPYWEMNVGDSIVTDHNGQHAFHQYAKLHKHFEFTSHDLGEGKVRVWRVK